MTPTPIHGFRLSPKLLRAIDADLVDALEAKLAADTPSERRAPFVDPDKVLETADGNDERMEYFIYGFQQGWQAAREAS